MNKDSGSKFRLKILSNKAATYTRLYSSFIEMLPTTLRADMTKGGRTSRHLTITDIHELHQATDALRKAIMIEINWMKKAHRIVLVRKGADYTKKEYLLKRIEELETSAPTSDEITTHMNELITIEHSTMACDRLKVLVDNFSDYLENVKHLMNTQATKNPMGVARELENLLSDLLAMAQEADEVALISSEIMSEREPLV